MFQIVNSSGDFIRSYRVKVKRVAEEAPDEGVEGAGAGAARVKVLELYFGPNLVRSVVGPYLQVGIPLRQTSSPFLAYLGDDSILVFRTGAVPP